MDAVLSLYQDEGRIQFYVMMLLLLPADANKLLMQWKEPYEITSSCGKCKYYQVEVNKKVKTLYANMLKKYRVYIKS